MFGRGAPLHDTLPPLMLMPDHDQLEHPPLAHSTYILLAPELTLPRMLDSFRPLILTSAPGRPVGPLFS